MSTTGHGVRRKQVRILPIVNSVTRALRAFKHTISHALRDPESVHTSHIGEVSLVPWEELPTACKFRNPQPSAATGRRRATAKDRVEQQQDFQRYLQWADYCAVTREELLTALHGVPSTIQQRSSCGVSGIPKGNCFF